jgi:hypothetical protein
LKKPNPGAPGGDRIVIELEGVFSEFGPIDNEEQQIDSADLRSSHGMRELDVGSRYEVPNPHPGEELKRKLRYLIVEDQYELVARQEYDLLARWTVIEPDQLDGLNDDLFNYSASFYGPTLQQQ